MVAGMFRFDDKVVVITGAAAGIGAAAAKMFSDQGAVVAVTDVNMELAEKTVNEIAAAGGKAKAYYCDVSSRESVDSMIDEVTADFGTVDVMVDNAGGTHGAVHSGNIEEYTDEEFDGVVKRNLYGAFYLCRKVIPMMKEKRAGKIVIVSSGAGRTTSRSEFGRIPYAPSKAAQLGLMRQLALECAPFNIQINGVAPGLIKSTQYIEDNWNTNTPEQKEATLKKIPAGRRGTSEEIAAGILFMASEEASYVTGHCLDINGGSLMM